MVVGRVATGAMPGVSLRVMSPLGSTIFAEERHEDQPKHVKRGHPRRDYRQRPQRGTGEERQIQDFVLAEEARQSGHTSDRERPHKHGHEGGGHVELHVAHLLHVLLVMHRVDDRPAAEKQQGLEERMGHEMKRTGRERADSGGEKHVSKLRHRRVRQHLLDVGLDQTNGGSRERRHPAYHGDNSHHGGCMREEHRIAADHVDTGGHHRGRVNQRRHRGRALHRIR